MSNGPLVALLRHLRSLAGAGEIAALSDRHLLERYALGRDEAAFAALLRRHGGMVWSVCRRVLADDADADDAFQATFLVLIHKAATLRGRESLAGWLQGVAWRLARKVRADAARRRLKEARAEMPRAMDFPAEVERRDLRALLDEELERLPEKYRAPLVLCYLEGLSYTEAARQLGWRDGTVCGRLARARELLRQRLSRRGLTLSGAALGAALTESSPAPAAAVAAVSRMAALFALGETVAGAVSPPVATLAQGVLQAMSLAKLKTVVALVTVLGLFAAGAGWTMHGVFAEKPAEAQPTAQAPKGEAGRPARKDSYGDPLPPQVIARLGTLRFRGVRGSLTFSPDGKWLAGETERGVTLWETATGCVIRQLRAPGMHLSFSVDGKRLACSDNLHCHVLEVSSGKELHTVKGTHGIFANDGKTLVTADVHISPWRVHRWDARTGQQLREWAAGEWIQEFALAAEGGMAAWMNQDKPAIRIRDLKSGAMKHSIPIVANSRSLLALTPDGKMLAVGSGKGIQVWDVATGKAVHVWSGRMGSPPIFSPDGQRLAWIGFGKQSRAAELWTVEREGGKPRAVGEEVNNFQPPCFSPDGKLLAVMTDAHVVSLRDVASGKETVSFHAHSRPLIDSAFSADGQQVVTRGDNDLFVWQARTGKLLRRSPLLPPGHEYLARLLSGGYVLTGERTSNPLQGRFWLRDMRTGENVLRFEGRPDVGPPKAVTAPGGRFVAVRGRAGEICVLNVSQRRCIYRLDPKQAASGLKLSADGEVLVWYRRKNTSFEISVHRRTTKKTLALREPPKGDSIRRCLDKFACMSPDGRWLLLPSEGGRLRRWDLTTGEEASPLTEALTTVWEFTWSPDGRFVVARGSASPSNVIDQEALRDVRVWDVRAGTRLPHLTVPNRQGGIHVLFSHDGCTMLTTDLQGVIHLWEVATGKERGRLRGQLPYEIGALALSADGRMLVSGGYDSQGFVWDLTGRMLDGQWHRTRLSSEQRRAAWEVLASTDAKAAYRALWQLAADPQGTVVFLSEQVRPIARPDPKQVADWLTALDSPEFAERERAERALESCGESVAAEMRQTLTQKPSLEVRQRIEALLEKLSGVPQGGQLQALRAVEVLENVNTSAARTLLRKLAQGAAGTRLTEQARESLNRLEKRTAP